MLRSSFILAILLMILLGACAKEDEQPVPVPAADMILQVRHQAGADSLVLERTFYKNSSGNALRVTKLKYFLSGFVLYAAGRPAYSYEVPQLIHAAYPGENIPVLPDVPFGKYDSLRLSLGVIPAWNSSGSITLQPNNYGMYWPEELGGGYHFMKLEGHWTHDSGFGTYAFHIGQNENIVTCTLPLELEHRDERPGKLRLTMDILEWFDHPYRYDLRYEDGYTMANGPQMAILKRNGHNVWQIEVL